MAKNTTLSNLGYFFINGIYFIVLVGFFSNCYVTLVKDRANFQEEDAYFILLCWVSFRITVWYFILYYESRRSFPIALNMLVGGLAAAVYIGGLMLEILLIVDLGYYCNRQKHSLPRNSCNDDIILLQILRHESWDATHYSRVLVPTATYRAFCNLEYLTKGRISIGRTGPS